MLRARARALPQSDSRVQAGPRGWRRARRAKWLLASCPRLHSVAPVTAERADVQAVIDGFTAAWAHPNLDHFMALLHPDVLLLQPVTKPIHGRDAARVEFAQLLGWLPDLRGTVDHTAATANIALIAWRLAFALGGKPYELRIVDRLVVEDGLIREREAYYDSLGLMIALLGRPSGWLGYWKYRSFLPS